MELMHASSSNVSYSSPHASPPAVAPSRAGRASRCWPFGPLARSPFRVRAFAPRSGLAPSWCAQESCAVRDSNPEPRSRSKLLAHQAQTHPGH